MWYLVAALVWTALWLVQFVVILGLVWASEEEPRTRKDFGSLTYLSILIAMVPILGLLLTYCMTGFGEKGWELPWRKIGRNL